MQLLLFMEGRSVFCKHVVWCGKNVRVAADTPILFENRVIAVGRGYSII